MHHDDFLIIDRLRRRLKMKLMELKPFPRDFRIAGTGIAYDELLSVGSEDAVQTDQAGGPRMTVVDYGDSKVRFADCKQMKNDTWTLTKKICECVAFQKKNFGPCCLLII